MKGVLIGALAITVLAFPETILAQPAASNPPAVSSGHTGSQTRAHHRRHAAHSAKSKSTKGSTSANQLNREELSRFQATNPNAMNRMPAGGRPTSGNTVQ
jgi:hypothetical protein